MTLSTALCAAVGALAIGTSAWWANPHRGTNRALAVFSIFLAAWLLAYHFAVVRLPLAWGFELVWFAAGFFPLGWIVLREVAVGSGVREAARRLRAWWIVPLLYGAIAFGVHLLSVGPGGVASYSKGYYILLGAGLWCGVVFGASGILRLRGLVGIRRLELQLVTLLACVFIFLLHGLPLIGAMAGDTTLDRLMALGICAEFGVLAWAMVSRRILDARHLLTLWCEQLVLVAAVTLFVWAVEQLALQFMPEWLALGISVALGLWFASEIRPWLQEMFQRKARIERVRRAAFDIARKELRPDKLNDAYEALLKEWANAEHATILMASQGRLTGEGVDWQLDRPELKLLQTLRWATPERFERERPRAHATELAQWMRENKFAAIATSPGPALSFVVAVGVPRTRRPFIYPEIAELLGIQSIVESALARAHYLMKAQHAEQLATVGLMGASLAHEIRNPLVSIKTFVQLLPQRYQDEAFREKFSRLIGDEVGRIDRLTEQLLDLSAPRTFSAQQTAIHHLLSGCVELIAAKADDKGVKIVTDFKAQNDVVYTDPSAVKQVILNLGFNAIQALEQQAGERLVKLTSLEVGDALEITVSDNGPGISPEIWGRLFQPFQSTKSSGFGLGLAICKDILSSLQANIVADPPIAGSGATFRITLPCQPPTS